MVPKPGLGIVSFILLSLLFNYFGPPGGGRFFPPPKAVIFFLTLFYAAEGGEIFFDPFFTGTPQILVSFILLFNYFGPPGGEG